MFLFLIIFGILLVITILCAGLALAFQRSQQNKQFRAMLRRATSQSAARELNILAPEPANDLIRRFLNSFGPTKALDQIMDQAGMEWDGAQLIMLAAGMSVV